MEKTEFINAMKDYATKNFGEATIEEVKKGSYTYTGLMIKKPNIPSPVVNLDDLYARYKDNILSLDECYKRVGEILNMVPDQPIDITTITDWEKAKERLFIRVLGKKPDGVYRQLADLYLIPYIQITSDGCSVTKVTPQLLDMWNIDEDEVFDVAEKNQETIRPAKVTHICEEIGLPTDGMPPIYIVTTKNGINGASAVFYNGMVDLLKNMLGEEFYLIPSSIHEMLAVPKSLNDNVEELAQMVTSINGSEVQEKDRLTNSVYTYDFIGKEFIKVS